EHKETPGLGSKMDVWFNNADKPGQNVIGKSPATTKFSVSKDGGDIDAITASTITSRAFLDALVRAYAAFEKTSGTLSGETAEKTN
ncbi:MAG TPA: FMN-binding protein, partial [Prolixibacteraceae bacterium]|nr:FMN-binding protein [Prolixibacteraceae bacterium]